jgi:hypothetical protein
MIEAGGPSGSVISRDDEFVQLLPFFRNGNSAFEATIAGSQAYRAKIRILDASGPVRLAASVSEMISNLGGLIENCAKLGADCPYFDDLEERRKDLARYEKNARTLSSEEKLSKIREHYRATLEAVRAEADRRRMSQAKLLEKFAAKSVMQEAKAVPRMRDLKLAEVPRGLAPAREAGLSRKREEIFARWDAYILAREDFKKANRGVTKSSPLVPSLKKRMAEIKADGDAVVDEADAYNDEVGEILRRRKK